ncbi:MAG: VOC family protein [Clostridia bacterium]|nr:VOC family protein [Clostridia bacterium]
MKIVPEFIVKDIVKSVKLFTEVLNMYIDFTDSEDENYKWAQLSKDGECVMLQEREAVLSEIPDIPKELGSSMLIVFKYSKDDALTIYNKIKGVYKLFVEFHQTEYGSVEFGFYDGDNYRILISGE